MKPLNRFLIIGSGGREHAIAESLRHTRTKKYQPELFISCLGTHSNPGLIESCDDYNLIDCNNADYIPSVIGYALDNKIQCAVIGPEAPLEDGIVDALHGVGIPCIGPFSDLAAIETYKIFARHLLSSNPDLTKYNPKYYHYDPVDSNDFEPNTLSTILEQFPQGYVIKAVGLRGGKGVKVSGDHFEEFEEAYDFCQELADSDGEFLIEERLVGREFSLMSLCDGTTTMLHLPVVQDYKRRNNNDQGPNTGGMGAIMRATSTADGSDNLPAFLSQKQLREAQRVNQLVLADLMKDSTKTGQKYIGILYGSFMITTTGELKVIEYNARFGDPEVICLLNSLRTDLSSIFTAMVQGSLKSLPPLEFKKENIVCRYLVPPRYPTTVDEGITINLHKSFPPHSVICSHVELDDGSKKEEVKNNVWMTFKLLGSRAVAVVTSDLDPHKAVKSNDQIIWDHFMGNFRYRTDIGSDLDESAPTPMPPFIPATVPKSSLFKSKIANFMSSHRRTSTGRQRSPMQPKLSQRHLISGQSSLPHPQTTYESAGVSIDEGNRAVDLIKSNVQSTQNEFIPRDQYGAFAGLYNIGQLLQHAATPAELGQMQLVSSMDGVGTKVQTVVNLLISNKDEAFYRLGQDLFANNINDILCTGRDVKPLFFLDYYGTNKLNADHLAKFVEGLSKSCRDSSCVLLGGETAELPDFSSAWRNYHNNSNNNKGSGVANKEAAVATSSPNWEMVGVIVGLIHGPNRFDRNQVRDGDVVLAIPSSGPHTNGYSLINKLITEGKLDPKNWLHELTCPHRNYYQELNKIWRSHRQIQVKGLCHITGGGLIDNPPRILPDGVEIEWKQWQLPGVFKEIQRVSGLNDEHMRRTFNCGLGMLMVVPNEVESLDHLYGLIPDLMNVGTIKNKK